MEDIVQFLNETFVEGRAPSLDGAPRWWHGKFQALIRGKVAFVKDPIHAVCLGIVDAPVVGGLTFGTPGCIETLPDLLLGVVDGSGTFRWAGGGYGEIVSLHSGRRPSFGSDGWPVWFTFASHDGLRQDLISSGQHVVDLSEHWRRRKALEFWDTSKKEFVEMTWAPCRLAWCLEWDEYSDIFVT